MRIRNGLVGVAALGAAFLCGQMALAHETGQPHEHSKAGGGASAGGSVSIGGGATATGTGEHPETGEAKLGAEGTEGKKEEEEESGLSLGVDLVVGFGKTDVVNQDILPGPNGVAPVTTIDASRVTVESFILSGGFEPVHHFGIGARIPLSLGTFSSAGRESRGTSSLGNIELGMEYEAELSEQVKLIPDLGFALPTGQGDEVPDSVDKVNTGNTGGRIDQNSYDRFAINKAAAAARGWEDNALFEPKRFGIIPKLSLEYKSPSGLRIVPYIKLENLVDTTGNADKKYIGELVAALRIAYRVSKQFEPGIRVWGNITVAGPDTKPAAVLEPEVRLHFGVATPYLGVIIPFAGPIAQDPSQFIGVRVGVAAKF